MGRRVEMMISKSENNPISDIKSHRYGFFVYSVIDITGSVDNYAPCGLTVGSFFMDNKGYTVRGGKLMKNGYTTGSCAAAASSAAAYMLLTGHKAEMAEIDLPSGERAAFEIHDAGLFTNYAICSVTKDGGDDPDVTTGLSIFAKVEYTMDDNIKIDGGDGIGRVTAKGLQCPVGEAAINPVPRKMINENVASICKRFEYSGGLSITISAPGGEKTALKTFNPRLGIIGGISILGTTGIVEPMSEKALIDTIKVEIDKTHAYNNDYILITPGNYGSDYCQKMLGIDIKKAVQISNYVGESLDYIKYKGFKHILLVGHTGKMVKIAAGVMNTHSSYADCRMETIAAYSAALGADRITVNSILSCVTTDDAFDTVKDEPYYENLKQMIMDKALDRLNFRLKGSSDIELVMFTTEGEHTILSSGAFKLIEYFKEK